MPPVFELHRLDMRWDVNWQSSFPEWRKRLHWLATSGSDVVTRISLTGRPLRPCATFSTRSRSMVRLWSAKARSMKHPCSTSARRWARVTVTRWTSRSTPSRAPAWPPWGRPMRWRCWRSVTRDPSSRPPTCTWKSWSSGPRPRAWSIWIRPSSWTWKRSPRRWASRSPAWPSLPWPSRVMTRPSRRCRG